MPLKNKFSVGDVEYVGEFTKFTFPQKNKQEKSIPLTRYFGDVLGDKYKIAELGNFNMLFDEMNKYDNSKHTQLAKLLDETDGDLVETEVFLFLSQFLRPGSTSVNFETMYHSINQQGATGFNGKGTKGDFIRKNPNTFIKMLYYPQAFMLTDLNIYCVTNKEEVRAADKNTRTYQFPPAWSHFCSIIPFLGLNKAVSDRWKEGLPFMPGYSPQNEADYLIQSMKRNDKLPRWFIEWDGKNYDRSHNVYLIQRTRNVRMRLQKFLEPDSKNIVRLIAIMYGVTMDRIHVLPNGLVVISRGGNPSGWICTTIDNCITHLIIFSLMLQIYHRDTGIRIQLQELITETSWGVYGDDGKAGVFDEKYHRFYSSIPDLWLKVTGKTCEVVIHETLDDFTFLGHKYFEHRGKYFAYAAEVDKAAYGLLHIDGKDLTSVEEQIRVYGQWLCFKNLFLKPELDAKHFSYLMKLDGYLKYHMRCGYLDKSIERPYLKQLATISQLK